MPGQRSILPCMDSEKCFQVCLSGWESEAEEDHC